MAFLAYALPIAPGQAGRAGSFGADMTPEHREHYEHLNRQANVRRHLEWIQSSPMGDLLIVVFESDTPEKLGRPFEDNAYDRWWTARVKAVHGFDPLDPNFEPVMPRLTWDWHDEVSTGHS